MSLLRLPEGAEKAVERAELRKRSVVITYINRGGHWL